MAWKGRERRLAQLLLWLGLGAWVRFLAHWQGRLCGLNFLPAPKKDNLNFLISLPICEAEGKGEVMGLSAVKYHKSSQIFYYNSSYVGNIWDFSSRLLVIFSPCIPKYVLSRNVSGFFCLLPFLMSDIVFFFSHFSFC